MMRLASFCVCTLLAVNSVQAADIVWVSFHSDDNNPSVNAANLGFTQAPDIGYTQLLQNNGHTVTRLVTLDNAGVSASVLNEADLVIVSRSVPSGHYQTDAETAFWNGITAPTMNVGGFGLRGGASGNVRLGYMQGDVVVDVSSNSMRLTINSPAHPVFSGISLDAGNTMVNPFADRVLLNLAGTDILQRGISVVTGAAATGGTILATVGTAGDAALGGMIIGEWPAGTAMNTTANGGPADVLGGPRMVFLTGSREHAAPPNTSGDIAGIFDLNPDGSRMFLNAVNYMAVPEPSSALLLSLGAGVACLVRRRRS